MTRARDKLNAQSAKSFANEDLHLAASARQGRRPGPIGGNRMFMEGVLWIARRYDKTDQSFAALINLVAIAMAMK